MTRGRTTAVPLVPRLAVFCPILLLPCCLAFYPQIKLPTSVLSRLVMAPAAPWMLDVRPAILTR
jgi:hypothetical protein